MLLCFQCCEAGGEVRYHCLTFVDYGGLDLWRDLLLDFGNHRGDLNIRSIAQGGHDDVDLFDGKVELH